MEEREAASGAGELCGVEEAGEGVALPGFFCLVEVSIMKQQQAASSAGELRETKEAGEGVAIFGVLPSRLLVHCGEAASRF